MAAPSPYRAPAIRTVFGELFVSHHLIHPCQEPGRRLCTRLAVLLTTSFKYGKRQ